jgi:hypothetical protein
MLTSRHLACILAAVSVGAVVHGCDGNSGNRVGRPNYFQPIGGAGGGSTVTPDVTATAPANATGATVGATNVHIMTLRLVNSSATTPAQLASFKVNATGTVDESTTLIKLSVIQDLNVNGLIEQGEPTLTSTAPAFPVNDGSVTFTLTPALTIPQNGTVQLLLAIDMIASTGLKDQIPLCGQRINVNVTDMIVLQSSTPFTPTGAFPLTNQPVPVGINSHVLITEVSYANGNAEFIEFFNPTGSATNIAHLTDYTADNPQPVPPRFYYLRPQPPFDAFGPVDPQVGRDFVVLLAMTIQPGEFLVVALDGLGFTTAFPNVVPAASLRNPGTASIWDATPPGQWVSGSIGPQVDLNDNGEMLIHFGWDGTSDLIVDGEIVGWGTKDAATGNEAMISKTGVSVDGPDAGNTQTPFPPETSAAVQEQAREPIVAPNSGLTMQRVRYDEQTQVGADETSEKWDQNFISAPATPGAANP